MGPPERERRFEEMYLAHYPAVSAYVRRRTDSPDDLADVIAETFTTAWRRLPEVPEGDGARLWLYGVARRTLANHFRSEGRRTALASRLREELTAWTGPVVDGDHDGVRRAFRQLPPDDRELLALIGWEGLTIGEAATVLGCSGGAARLRLHRARKRLARALAAADLDLSRYGARAVSLAEGHS
ncbi:RNA polymerase sigma factor [Nonomuraea sp. NPDC059194]|uniref:RNA polymerase sigma factor n=1 Tax=Nonomuraea sp. NPDC059194 TaxID=3346764 RepID=UPI003699250A